MSYGIKVSFRRELGDDLDVIGKARPGLQSRDRMATAKALVEQFVRELQCAYEVIGGQLPMAGTFEVESIKLEGRTYDMKELGL